MFAGSKTVNPIPVTSSLHHDLLIYASLDPAVLSIDFVPDVSVAGCKYAVNGAVFQTGQARFLIEVEGTNARNGENLAAVAADDLGLDVFSVAEDELKREPFASNRRLVWQCRDHGVGAGERVRIFRFLAEEGGVAALGDFEGHGFAASDPVSAALHLVCSDLLEADLAGAPLGPATKIRLRSNGGKL
jgi:hypothetical protein